VSSLALIYALRMYGLFLLLPVLSIYSSQLKDATPFLVGLAFGAYGLTQAILQIPFGLMSDRWGRKPVIISGLLIFIFGSIVAALSTSIHGIIVGRALQGAGAIAAAVIALTADLTRENQRTKAMAFVGMSIGLSFMLALLSAPILAAKTGLNGLFVIIAVLAALALLVVMFVVPNVQRSSVSRDARAIPADIPALIKHPQLLRMDIGIFILHMVLTATFFVVPLMIAENFDLAVAKHWQLYLPALLLSIPAMVPLIIYGAKNDKTVQMFVVAIGILCVSQLLFLGLGSYSLWLLGLSVFVFFWGFNALEAMLPSLITRIAPAQAKGTAVGIYNSFQFAGVFIGGIAAGYLYTRFGSLGVFVFSGLSLLLWLALAVSAPAVTLMDSRIVNVALALDNADVTKVQSKLSSIRGVHDVSLIMEERLAYLKVNKKDLDIDAIDTLESGLI